jgi:hypothetical protein
LIVLLYFHAFRPYDSDGGGAFQEFHERHYRFRSCRSDRNAGGHSGVVLQRIRQWANEVGAGLLDDFADLGHAERTVTLRKSDFRDIPAPSKYRLCLQLLGKSQLLDHTRNMDAGGTATNRLGVDDGFSA